MFIGVIIINQSVGGGLQQSSCVSVCSQAISENTAFYVWSNIDMESTYSVENVWKLL